MNCAWKKYAKSAKRECANAKSVAQCHETAEDLRRHVAIAVVLIRAKDAADVPFLEVAVVEVVAVKRFCRALLSFSLSKNHNKQVSSKVPSIFGTSILSPFCLFLSQQNFLSKLNNLINNMQLFCSLPFQPPPSLSLSHHP